MLSTEKKILILNSIIKIKNITDVIIKRYKDTRTIRRNGAL